MNDLKLCLEVVYGHVNVNHCVIRHWISPQLVWMFNVARA